jgi:hypothetical protein
MTPTHHSGLGHQVLQEDTDTNIWDESIPPTYKSHRLTNTHIYLYSEVLVFWRLACINLLKPSGNFTYYQV